jgi:predicted ribosome-associated RNA-binding protein Tma20
MKFRIRRFFNDTISRMPGAKHVFCPGIMKIESDFKAFKLEMEMLEAKHRERQIQINQMLADMKQIIKQLIPDK